ncbi:MAG TPA: hypothetical protein PJ991_00570 [Kiritimatiellia bacterium]|nr:hypothetical protein [Kiritimatiellia bacterium]
MQFPLKKIIMTLAVIAIAVYFWPNELRKVEKRTKAMLSTMNKKGPENLALASARVLNVVSYFAPDAVIIPGYPTTRRLNKSDATTLLQQARVRLSKLDVSSRGRNVTRLNDDQILVDLTLEAFIEYQGTRDEYIGTFRIVWTKSGGEWLITLIEPLDIIRHPAHNWGD